MKAGKLTLRRVVAVSEKPDIVYNFFRNKKAFWKSATQGYSATIAVTIKGLKAFSMRCAEKSVAI